MAIIGTFIKQDNGAYTGSLATLIVKTKVGINPVEKTSDKAPDFRIFAGTTEVGAAWTTQSKEKKSYLSVKLDDPSFPAAILCRLVETSDGYSMVWSR